MAEEIAPPITYQPCCTCGMRCPTTIAHPIAGPRPLCQACFDLIGQTYQQLVVAAQARQTEPPPESGGVPARPAEETPKAPALTLVEGGGE